MQWRIQHRAYPAYAPPPVICENIAFSCIFFNKVKLTPLFSAKMWLTPPPLAHSGSATDMFPFLTIFSEYHISRKISSLVPKNMESLKYIYMSRVAKTCFLSIHFYRMKALFKQDLSGIKATVPFRLDDMQDIMLSHILPIDICPRICAVI